MSRVSIFTLTPAQARAVGLIGQPVTVGDHQYILRSIEGGSWYAHLSTDGHIVIDTFLSGGQWITEPVANILPAGCQFGQGFTREVPLRHVKQGVSLVKAYA